MKDRIKVIVKRHNEPIGHTVMVDNSLEQFQKLVGGHIEVVGLTPDVLLVCNEEGLINNLPYNCTVDGMTLYGDIVLVGVDGEDFTDVPISVGVWRDYLAKE